MAMSEAEVSAALAEALRECGDDERRWEIVTGLQLNGGAHARAAAGRLIGSRDPQRRRLAVDVLGQLGAAPGRAAVHGPYREEALTLLLGMAGSEPDAGVLASIAVAFGHIGDARCVGPLVALRGHPDPRVRHSVAFGLIGRDDPGVAETLETLARDPDAEVRDWARFALGWSAGDGDGADG
ncbi:HEAT repeat domain-containing protein [Dactylosporangium sp. CA-233914]|uniref:HEAT repeat domain-containing protein n=1 Tax=Dactylosporangium sp. CA-233914 TaxID=3239934 RepID=UPI003D8FDE72